MTMHLSPKRGDLWIISLDPTKGSEIKKTRPCLIISRSEYNEKAGTVTIIPCTSGEVSYPAWEVKIGKSAGLSTVSHLVLPQIRVCAKERLKKRVGAVTSLHWLEIEHKLFFYLGFDHLIKSYFAEASYS